MGEHFNLYLSMMLLSAELFTYKIQNEYLLLYPLQGHSVIFRQIGHIMQNTI